VQEGNIEVKQSHPLNISLKQSMSLLCSQFWLEGNIEVKQQGNRIHILQSFHNPSTHRT
jgi:hypothetical protein